MTVAANLDADTLPIRGGWRVQHPDGTARTVFQRLSGDGWAVFSGTSTNVIREPALGYAGSWRSTAEEAIDWARYDR